MLSPSFKALGLLLALIVTITALDQFNLPSALDLTTRTTTMISVVKGIETPSDAADLSPANLTTVTSAFSTATITELVYLTTVPTGTTTVTGYITEIVYLTTVPTGTTTLTLSETITTVVDPNTVDPPPATPAVSISTTTIPSRTTTIFTTLSPTHPAPPPNPTTVAPSPTNLTTSTTSSAPTGPPPNFRDSCRYVDFDDNWQKASFCCKWSYPGSTGFQERKNLLHLGYFIANLAGDMMWQDNGHYEKTCGSCKMYNDFETMGCFCYTGEKVALTQKDKWTMINKGFNEMLNHRLRNVNGRLECPDNHDYDAEDLGPC